MGVYAEATCCSPPIEEVWVDPPSPGPTGTAFVGSGFAAIFGQELAEGGLSFAAAASEPRAVLAPDPADPEDRPWEGVHAIEHPRSAEPILIGSEIDTLVGPYQAFGLRGGPHPVTPDPADQRGRRYASVLGRGLALWPKVPG